MLPPIIFGATKAAGATGVGVTTGAAGVTTGVTGVGVTTGVTGAATGADGD